MRILNRRLRIDTVDQGPVHVVAAAWRRVVCVALSQNQLACVHCKPKCCQEDIHFRYPLDAVVSDWRTSAVHVGMRALCT